MQATVTAKQLREDLSNIVDRVEAGDEVVVIRRSKPAIRLIPEKQSVSRYAGSEVGKRLDALLKDLPSNVSPTLRDPKKDYKQLRDEIYRSDPKYRRYLESKSIDD